MIQLIECTLVARLTYLNLVRQTVFFFSFSHVQCYQIKKVKPPKNISKLVKFPLNRIDGAACFLIVIITIMVHINNQQYH